jgi:hypothetical protein
MGTVIPFAEAAAALRQRRARAMFNLRLLNPADIIKIGLIAIVFHILLKPLLARVDLTPASSSGASAT